VSLRPARGGPPRRPVLLSWLDGLPTIEAVAHLLARLQARGRLEVRLLLPAGKFPADSPTRQTLCALGLEPVPISRLRSKFLYGRDLRAADAVLALTDPALDRSSRRLRAGSIMRAGKPVVFVQHGAYAAGVNAPLGGEGRLDYYAQRLLLWQNTPAEAAILSEATLRNVRVTGFLKQPFLPFAPVHPAVAAWQARHPHRVLLCQSFRWRTPRYTADHIADWYRQLDAFLARHRDIGVLLRPHRGKANRRHSAHDEALRDRHPNLLVSLDDGGPLHGAAIHDCIALCDTVVCPESTVVLDALYLDRPVLVSDIQSLIFPELPRVESMDDIARLIREPDLARRAGDAVRARYGTLADNLERACDHIEAVVA